MSSIEAIYAGGVFRPLGEVEIAENQRVLLTIETSPVASPAAPIRTAQDLLDSKLVGSWADRDDIQDSQAFARQLRDRAEARGAFLNSYGPEDEGVYDDISPAP